jgi:hypothetical protein
LRVCPGTALAKFEDRRAWTEAHPAEGRFGSTQWGGAEILTYGRIFLAEVIAPATGRLGKAPSPPLTGLPGRDALVRDGPTPGRDASAAPRSAAIGSMCGTGQRLASVAEIPILLEAPGPDTSSSSRLDPARYRSAR